MRQTSRLTATSQVSQMLSQEPLVSVARWFTQQGWEAYLVGGLLRDALLGRPTHDVDLALKGDVQEMGQRLALALGGSYVCLDDEHGVARVAIGEGDGRWVVDLATMAGEVADDLQRRDLTINAMALPLPQGGEPFALSKLIDPCAGLQDLEAGVVRAVQDDAFQRDPVRLLRTVRLAAELGFAIEERTLQLMERGRLLVQEAAGERLGEELGRLLVVPQATPWLELLDEVGLLDALFPELAQTKGVEQPKEHYWDVFHHCLRTVAEVERLLALASAPSPQGPSEQVVFDLWDIPVVRQHFRATSGEGQGRVVRLKLAALLHDVGKPATKAPDQEGRTRFFGHSQLGAQMTKGVLERFRFSAREIHLTSLMVEYHLRPSQLGDDALPSDRAIYRYFRDLGEVALDTLWLNLADHLATRGPKLDLAEWQRHVAVARYLITRYLEKQEIQAPPKLVNGHELMAYFGLRPGPLLGELLEVVREAQAAGEVRSREEALALVKQLVTGHMAK